MLSLSNFPPLILLLLLCSTINVAQSVAPPPPSSPPPPPPPPGIGNFDYYIVAIQWPISFCNIGKSSKCTDNNYAQFPLDFKLHGSWPTKVQGNLVISGEKFDLNQISNATQVLMVADWPDMKYFSTTTKPSARTYAGFWDHEWTEHGRASGLSQSDYFELTLRLKKAIDQMSATFMKNYKPGTVINVTTLRNEFSRSNAVPFPICNRNAKKQDQLHELRFEVTQAEVFRSNGTISGCPDLVVFPDK